MAAETGNPDKFGADVVGCFSPNRFAPITLGATPSTTRPSGRNCVLKLGQHFAYGTFNGLCRGTECERSYCAFGVKRGELDAMCLPVANWTLWMHEKKSTTANVINLVTPCSAKRSRAEF
jgi:hypothetical protein